MSKLSFVKYHGAGNDFILIDNRALFFDPACVPALCHRKMGIGADGVILLEPHSTADFRMRIFNCDGSEAASCGNGLRCLMRFIVDLGLPRKTYQIAAGATHVEIALLEDNRAHVHLGKTPHVKPLYIEGRELFFTDTGVPHAVQFVSDVHQVDVAKEGAVLRRHPHFAPHGTNVNFATLLPDGSIAIRTYERGVEGETLACGTGATAVGVVAVRVLGRPSRVHIRCLGGELEIHIADGLRMVGDAVRVFAGTWSFFEDKAVRIASI